MYSTIKTLRIKLLHFVLQLIWRQTEQCMSAVYATTVFLHTHTHTRLVALFPGLPGWAGTRKVKPIWILLKQESVSGSGISWAVCKSATRSRQITMPAPHHWVFYRPDALPAAQPTASKHWRQNCLLTLYYLKKINYRHFFSRWKAKNDVFQFNRSIHISRLQSFIRTTVYQRLLQQVNSNSNEQQMCVLTTQTITIFWAGSGKQLNLVWIKLAPNQQSNV